MLLLTIKIPQGSQEESMARSLIPGQINPGGVKPGWMCPWRSPVSPAAPPVPDTQRDFQPYYAPNTAETARKVSTIASENLLTFFDGGKIRLNKYSC